MLTYQAYNLWGGYSLYYGLDAQGNTVASSKAYAVSFDRPYQENAGLQDFARLEIPLLRWMERQGYDLSYATDVDAQSHGDHLIQHKLLVVAGHDEYWSTAMRANVTKARDAGVSLAFFGANDVYWHIRLQPSPLGPDRVEVCYKSRAPDPLNLSNPKDDTVNWRVSPVGQPENSLLGQMYLGQVIGSSPLVVAEGATKLNLLAGLALPVGTSFPGLVGGEFDAVTDNGLTPSSISVLASSPVRCLSGYCTPSGAEAASVSNATVYTAPSGARVFDAGTFFWSLGLDDLRLDSSVPAEAHADSRFQQFTANLINYLLRQPIG